METASLSEMSVITIIIYQLTQCNIPEHFNPYQYRGKNLRSGLEMNFYYSPFLKN